MIRKSDTSLHFYQNDIIYKRENKPEMADFSGYHEKEKTTLKKIKDMFKLDYFIISMNNGWKAAFDNVILIVIGYTCLTTVLFVSFDNKKNKVLNQIDYMVTAFFSLDILFNLMLEYQDKETF
jgi:hypothetical protein